MATLVAIIPAHKLTEPQYVAVHKQELVLIDETRLDLGLTPLKESIALDNSARQKCSDMVQYDYWAHNRTDKEWSQFVFANDNGLQAAGEILAKGFDDRIDEHNAWMASPNHKAEIVGYYTEFGSASCTYHNGVNLTVVHFGRR